MSYYTPTKDTSTIPKVSSFASPSTTARTGLPSPSNKVLSEEDSGELELPTIEDLDGQRQDQYKMWLEPDDPVEFDIVVEPKENFFALKFNHMQLHRNKKFDAEPGIFDVDYFDQLELDALEEAGEDFDTKLRLQDDQAGHQTFSWDQLDVEAGGNGTVDPEDHPSVDGSDESDVPDGQFSDTEDETSTNAPIRPDAERRRSESDASSSVD